MRNAGRSACRSLAAVLLAMSAASPLRAADEAALEIADRAASLDAPVARDWQLSLEGAAARARLRADGGSSGLYRGSLELRVDKSLAPAWRFVLADQLDASDPALPDHAQVLNSLKEAYLSWQPRSDAGFDLGRVNVQSGVALGYSPTNWFGRGALRGYPVIDPKLLRSRRLGTVVARGQALWDDGSFSALAAPRLTTQARSESWNDTFDLDLAATNDRSRGQLSLSQRWGGRFSTQALLYAESERPLQLGMILSGLLGEATTTFVEWAGGRDRSVLSVATGGPDDTSWRSRWAAGATYTTETRLSLSAEFHYNGAGLGRADWQALPLASPPGYAAVLERAVLTEEMPTRTAWFLYATWQDWPAPRFDSTALLRFNREDRSHLAWLELRWHAGDRIDLALQWQALSGGNGSEFGGSPESRRVTGILKVWL